MRGTDADRPVALVLMGGPDAEHEVSLMSGRAVVNALMEADEFDLAAEVIDRPDAAALADLVRRHRADVVFPVLHGPWGEGGELQEHLEEVGRPYVGSRPRPARLAMDKLATKRMLAAANVPTPPACRLEIDDACELELPLVLKPVNDGSSVDLRICRNAEELAVARAELHPRRDRLMAERFVAGREITAGLVGGEVLPLIEIVPATEFYDYEAKYERDDTRYVINPELPQQLVQACRDHAQLAYRRLGCRDVARADFMIDEHGPWLLEVNTMPGFTSHSLVPMAAAAAGQDMPELCTQLVATALARADVTPHPRESPIG